MFGPLNLGISGNVKDNVINIEVRDYNGFNPVEKVS